MRSSSSTNGEVLGTFPWTRRPIFTCSELAFLFVSAQIIIMWSSICWLYLYLWHYRCMVMCSTPGTADFQKKKMDLMMISQDLSGLCQGIVPGAAYLERFCTLGVVFERFA